MSARRTLVHSIVAALSGMALIASVVQAEVCPANLQARDTPVGDFVDNGNGTVNQQSTGLMWQKCVDGMSGTGCALGTPTSRTWSQALAFATGSNLAGYNDWRMPSQRELRAMINLSCHSPATDPVFGPAPGTPLWSSTTLRRSPGFAWQADINDGRLLFVPKTVPGTVRLVREGVNFDAARTVQTITGFAPVTPAVAGVASAVLSATGGGSPNPIVFATTSSASICTVSGNVVTFVASGTCNLTANQAGNSNFWVAPQVTASIVVQRLTQTITNFYPKSAVALGSAPLALTAAPGVTGNPLVFSSATPTVCTLSGATLTFVGLGNCDVRINQAGNASYNPAPTVGAVIVVRNVLMAQKRNYNDTGAALCFDAADVGGPCTQANSGDNSPGPRQDARYGRDPHAAAGLVKIGGGAAGFDFTKIANNGTVLPANSVLGSSPSDWACTRDNVTGLLWEVKTATGLRAATSVYTWYSTDATRNGGDVGFLASNNCTASPCNTQEYVAAVNAMALCGANDWRLPSVSETLDIQYFVMGVPLQIDTTYFPDTQLSGYWTMSTMPGSPSTVLVAPFFFGGGLGSAQKFATELPVMLVRGASN